MTGTYDHRGLGPRKFREHQEHAFSRFKESDAAAFLMEMRLGKTLVAIRWAQYRLNSRKCSAPRVLVVAPTTPLTAWMDELDMESVAWTVLSGGRSARVEEAKNAGWKLVTYQSLVRTPELVSMGWDAVILDESTAIKSPRAAVTKLCVRRLSRSTEIRAILTGEIEPEGIINTWTQMAFVSGGEWMGCKDFWTWQKRHFYRAWHSWVPKTGVKELVKKMVHSEAFCLTKKEAGLEPEWKRSRIESDMDDYTRGLYDQAVSEWKIPGVETKHAVVTVSWIRRMVGGFLPGGELPCWKYQALIEALDSDDQAVVWFQFRSELRKAWLLIREQGWSVTYVNGDVSLEDRRKKVKKFRSGEKRIFLAMARCGRFGLDLSTASTAIYFSSPYSYEDRRQSEERIATVSRKQELRVIDLTTIDSIDEDVLEAVQDKRSSAEWFAKKFMEKR